MNWPTWLPVAVLLSSPFVGMAQEAAAPQEVPAALAGLRFHREEAVQWYVVFNMEDGGKWKPWIVALGPDKVRFGNKNHPKPWLKPGDVFFKDGPMEGRFKFTGFVDKLSERISAAPEPEKLRIAQFEDLKPNKKGTKYESERDLPEAEYAAHASSDRSAVFTFKPKDEAETVEFKVEELTNFAVPPNGPAKDFLLKEVSAEKVVVEYKNQAGAVRQATIAKHVKDPAEALESLGYLRRETVRWYVKFGLENEGLWGPGRLVGTDGKKRLESTEMVWSVPMIDPGKSFPHKGAMKERFKFLGIVEKELKNPVSGVMEKRRVAEFEDLKPNKKGFKYDSVKDVPGNEIVYWAQSDHTAVFSFKVGGAAKATEFKVEELTDFALPPGAPGKDYLMKEVGEDKVVVEYKDKAGAVRSVTIPIRKE